jgi:hypothetical protein
VDGGSLPTAQTLIEKALSGSVHLRRWAALELWLQGTMFAALVERKAELAHQRLEEARRVPQGDANYRKLAEAAVTLNDGHSDAARGLLDEWLMLAKTSAGARYEVGNHWAIDLLRERLQPQGGPSQ